MKQILIDTTARWQEWIEVGWQASFLALIILLTVMVLRKGSAPLRHALLLVALVKFALPLVPSPVGVFPWLGERLEWPTVGLAVPTEAAANPAPVVPRTAVLEATSVATLSPSSLSLSEWMPLLMMAYAIGLFYFLGRLAWQRHQLSHWAGAGKPCTDPAVQSLFEGLTRRLNLRRQPRLLISDEPTVPAAFGIVKPTILLPRALIDGLDRAGLAAVLGHELAHHKRGDLWVHTAQRLLAAVWWFNPLYHAVDRALRSTREECCDDLVLALGIAEDRAYCQALLDSADLCAEQRPLALAASDGFQPLANRLTRVLDRSWHRASRLGWVGGVLVGLLAVIVLPGRMIALPVAEGAEDDLVLRQALTLQELQLRRAWPRFVLDHFANAEANAIELLDLEDETFKVDLKTQNVTGMAQLINQLPPGPFAPELKSMVQTELGSVGSLYLALETTVQAEEVSPELAYPDPPHEERNRLARELLLDGAAIGSTLMNVRGLLEASSVELVTFAPRDRIDHGLFSEWPLDLWISGEASERIQVLGKLAILSGVLIESIQSQGMSVTKLELRVLGLPSKPTLEGIEPRIERRYAETLPRLRRLAADLGC